MRSFWGKVRSCLSAPHIVFAVLAGMGAHGMGSIRSGGNAMLAANAGHVSAKTTNVERLVYSKFLFLAVLTVSLAGCSGFGLTGDSGLPGLAGLGGATATTEAAPAMSGPGEDQRRVQAVLDLRKRYRNSDDASRQQELNKAEAEAAAYFLTSGLVLAKQARYEEAAEKFDQGLLVQPGNGELLQARQAAMGRREVSRLYAEGQRAKSVGNTDLAETLFQRAGSLDGQNAGVKKELQDLDRSKRNEEQRFILAAFKSAAPVALNFREAKLKDAIKVLCDPYNLNFVYDKNTENLDVSVSAKNVSFEQAFNMVLQSSNTAYKVLGPNSLLIYEDTPEKKKQYADRYFKTFHLSTLKAERMAEILKASMDIKTLVANNDLGTIQVRDTRDTLDVIEKLIATNDRKPAEIMLNVEVLELDVSKANQVGIDWGRQISVQPPQAGSSSTTDASGNVTSTVSGALSDLLRGSSFMSESYVTLPTVTLNYLKSNTDARTLSNPRVRTVDGQPAKIHVGDKVPLQSATIQQATGQSSVMYEYHDVGIKLDVLPKYHLDDSIFIDLNIEVSSLGQNLGTAAAPAYSIQTRNVHTTMILREGETAMLGGLISEQESHSLNGIPGVNDGGLLGRLFNNAGDTGNRTELMLSITPRLVRSQSLPGRSNTDFYSGTEGSYSAKGGPYEYLKRAPVTDAPPKHRMPPNSKTPPAPDEASAGAGDMQSANFQR
jgi:general secretion pathway protein D